LLINSETIREEEDEEKINEKLRNLILQRSGIERNISSEYELVQRET